MSERSQLSLQAYFADIAEDMRRETEKLRRDFATHHPSGGENREAVVAEFLGAYLPKAFGVDTGLIFSQSGKFSHEADLVLVDQAWNAALHPKKPKKIWFVEAVYALIEVKTHLNPSDITNALKKCRRFKTLLRRFDDQPSRPRIADSLFILWGFEAPAPETLKKNLISAFEAVPIVEQPDFVIVPDLLVVKCGTYHNFATLGQPGSPRWQELLQETGGDLSKAMQEPIEVYSLGKYSLLVWLIWVTSWLKAAGQRSAPLTAYLTSDMIYGWKV